MSRPSAPAPRAPRGHADDLQPAGTAGQSGRGDAPVDRGVRPRLGAADGRDAGQPRLDRCLAGARPGAGRADHRRGEPGGGAVGRQRSANSS